ncbi:hypothetical protein GQX73_g6918 [Xylaria multiplex]|uniref:PD-(D/E)XK nuclease-like domain-containing protein n=1 Tax=Xylaria multiplex TaxID=323545 RepID=A0A7C8MS34_9PEZI|nr:hypothetical protein GQX73_g6918 [Xylaria multiplex]
MSDVSRGRKRALGSPPPLWGQQKRHKSNKKTKSILEMLENPINLRGLPLRQGNINELPKDIRSLYLQIYDASLSGNGVLPYALREEMTAVYRAQAVWFKEDDKTTKAEAVEVYNTLCEIIQRATDAFTYERHESSWNNLVHTPLLELIFTSRIFDTLSTAGRPVPLTRGVSIRFEPVTDALPLLCSGIDVPDTESNNDSQTDLSRTDVLRVANRGNFKRVDYVLVMDMPKTASLQKTISNLAFYCNCCELSHINQTTYRPIEKSLIAVSIKTKPSASSTEPLLQLGIWTAAWISRMYALRPSASRDPRPLVSLPMIQVVGHDWAVYFACDMGSYIDVHGPMKLGSTETIISTYTLVFCLKLIKTWIETTFQDAMKEWFNVKSEQAE